MKTIQLRANRYNGKEIVPALTKEEAEFFSVYKGEPGAFQWVADFMDPEVAYQHASKWQIEGKGAYRLDTAQFDALMRPEPKLQGHIHAERMAEYAEDAKTLTTPWLKWETRLGFRSSWVPLVSHPSWDIMSLYRRKRLPEICGACGQEIER